MFAATDIAAYLEAIGDDAMVADNLFKVDFNGPFETVDYRSGEIVSSEPWALANPADVAARGLVAGDEGSVISVMGREYRITSMEPEEAGFTILHLGRP